MPHLSCAICGWSPVSGTGHNPIDDFHKAFIRRRYPPKIANQIIATNEKLFNKSVEDLLKAVGPETCRACNGIIDYHTLEAAKRHLKMVSERWSKKHLVSMLITGISIGIIVFSLANYLIK